MKGTDLGNKENSFSKAYSNWETDMPSENLWSKLDESLSVEKVWQKVDESLRQEGSFADQHIAESFENWEPATNNDGWTKLQDELAKERVWNRLKSTLSRPIDTAVPWLQMVAASIIFMFISLQLSNQSISTLNKSNQDKNQTAVNVDLKIEKGSVDSEINSIEEEDFRTTENSVIKTSEIAKVEEKNKDLDRVEINSIESKNSGNEELIAQELGSKSVTDISKSISAFEFKGFPRINKPIWTLQVGPQFSFLAERNRTELSSSLPRIGISADLLFNHYFGRVRLTQGFGFSQYAQSTGNYINGRYNASNQRLNTLQATTLIGYNYKNVTVFGGILLNRLINGYETQKNEITNVYSIQSIQLGYTAGIDYQFRPFKNGTSFGVGAQYNLIPQLKSSNTVFENVQSSKVQIKFSF